jgi:FkbM family methyltransferase
MKKVINTLLRKLGYEVIASDLNNDRDAFLEQQRLNGAKSDLVIFDVGAHHGQTALTYSKLFKYAKIYSFEPYPTSFDILKEKTKHVSLIKPFNFALGNKNGHIEFHVNNSTATNSILGTSTQGHEVWGTGKLETQQITKVQVCTLDEFFKQESLAKIDILKLDTQGSEHLVLEGARSTLEKGMIKLVYTEIITMPTYENQKTLDEVLYIFKTINFRLHHFYNFSLTPDGQLRQLDAIFVRN